MTVQVGAEMCRLVVYGPDRRIEVAVPAHVVLADLLPVLSHHLGENLADTGLLHSGWVLQRLGAAPFDEDSTIAALGLRDGDTVHLRPRSEQIPPADFDDLIDGVATGIKERPGRWRPEMARWVAVGVLAALLATGLIALAVPGPPIPWALVAGCLAVAGLAAAFTVTQTVGDEAFAVTFAVAATGYAGLSGMLVVGVTGGARTSGPQVFAGGAAVLAAVIVGAVLIGSARPFFAGVLVATAVCVIGAALLAFVPVTVTQAAEVVTIVSTLAGTAAPQVAFRLAGLRLDPLPTEPEHLQEGLDPEPSEPLLERTVVVDRYLTALYIGLAVPVVAAMVVAAGAPGWEAATIVVLVALVRLLAARQMTSIWHRLAMGVPSVIGLAAVTLHLTAMSPTFRLVAPTVLVPAGAGLLFGLARSLPRRRMMPFWGRAGDLLQTGAMLAVLPVLLAAFGVYGYLRGLGG